MFVFPMAGLSKRFTLAGYTEPKFKLKAFGRTLFEHSVAGFSHYFSSHSFLFITLQEHHADSFIRESTARLGIPDSSVRVVTLSTPTAGQAETVWLGLEAIEAPDDAPITIFNIDTFRPGFRFPEFSTGQPDGYLETFAAAGDHWSFALPAAEPPGTDRVIEVAEKRRISEHACTGLYHFARAASFRAAYAAAAATPTALLEGGERYVAPLYNRLIRTGADVRLHEVPAEQVILCGTPEEYKSFLARSSTPTIKAMPPADWQIALSSHPRHTPGFDYISSHIDSIPHHPVEDIVAGTPTLSKSLLSNLKILEYHGSHPTLYSCPQSLITRHGLHPNKTAVLADTSLADIYPAQANRHAISVYAHALGLLSRQPLNSTHIPRAALISNSWDTNYQHFLIDTLPKALLLDEMLSPDVVFCATKTSFAVEILNACFPHRSFQFLESTDVVSTDQGWGVSSLAANMSPLSDIARRSLHLLRNRILSYIDSSPAAELASSNKAYIGRKLFHENHGNARVMLNEADLLHSLSRRDFVAIHFEGLTLAEKATILLGRKKIVTAVGAHIVNLLFARDEFDLIIIAHPIALGNTEWFLHFLRSVGAPLRTGLILRNSFGAADRARGDQQPFFVDLAQVNAVLDTEEFR